tara:strand:+ start:664 stop:1122 length:459 start_codon:yes stop_codon:yes gene_type:complete
MPDHIWQQVSDAIVTAITDAAITVDVGGSPAPLLVFDEPPDNETVDATETPAAFVNILRESVEISSVGYYRREAICMITLVARPTANAARQLFTMQSGIEVAIEEDAALAALLNDMTMVSSGLMTQRGEAVRGARSIEYRLMRALPRTNPAP